MLNELTDWQLFFIGFNAAFGACFGIVLYKFAKMIILFVWNKLIWN